MIRTCRSCDFPGVFVAEDADHLQWYDCGRHSPVATKLTPVRDWYRERGLRAVREPEDFEVATLQSDGSWSAADGTRWWFCAGASCPGYRWKASNTPHPASCRLPYVPPVPTGRR